MDLDRFLQDIPGNDGPTGAFLKYLPEYDEIRIIRKQDETIFPASLKEGTNHNREWKRLCTLCENILVNKSKDFQVALWLTEGWFYSDGIDGVINGIKLILSLIDKFWLLGHPPLEEDLEYRLAPFIWLNEKFSEKFIFLKITTTNTFNDNPYSYADWLDMKRLEMVIQKSKNAATTKDRAVKDGKILPDTFEKEFENTPIEFLKDMLSKISVLQNLLQDLDSKLDTITNGNGVSFVRFKKIIEEIRFLFDNIIPEEIPVVVEEIIVPEIIEEAPIIETTQDLSPQDVLPSQPIVVHQEGYTRESAYAELETIAAYLSVIEPHSPAPYLIRRSIQWGTMSLAELYEDLLINEGNLAQIMRLLGLATKEIPVANQPKKR